MLLPATHAYRGVDYHKQTASTDIITTEQVVHSSGELGDAGELLQQLADDDKLQQPEQQEEVLKEALEPSEAADKQAEAIPVEPAVTGELV